jgi:hypothetical protein
LQQLNLYVSTGASDDLPVLNKDSGGGNYAEFFAGVDSRLIANG